MNLQFLRASVAVLAAALAIPGAAACAQSLLVVNGTADPSQGSVLQYDLSSGLPISGGTLVPAGAGGLNDPTALAIGPGGNLFVANGFDSSILEFNSQGAFQGVFVSGGSGGLSNPTSLAFGPDGNLYVSSNGTSSVIEFSGVTGAFIQTLGTIPGAGGLSNPEGLTFYGGSLYVASQGNDAVLQYSFSTGQFSTFVQSGAGGLSLPSGLAFGPDGNLYVASAGSGSILSYYGTTGFFDQTFVSSGFGGLSTPSALAFEADGTTVGCQRERRRRERGDPRLRQRRQLPGYAGAVWQRRPGRPGRPGDHRGARARFVHLVADRPGDRRAPRAITTRRRRAERRGRSAEGHASHGRLAEN